MAPRHAAAGARSTSCEPMIQSLRFANYRVLRDAVLPLGPFTLLVGPNGSGKSTALHALRSLRFSADNADVGFSAVTSVVNTEGTASLSLTFCSAGENIESALQWRRGNVTLRDGIPLGSGYDGDGN